MGIFKKDKDKPTINWDLVDSTAREIFKLLHEKKQITFLEIDCILNLVSTECNNSKYVFLLGRKDIPQDINIPIKDVPGHIYG